MRKLILAAASVAALALAGPASAQSPIVIKFSHVVASNTPKGAATEKFKELAEKYTVGKVKIRPQLLGKSGPLTLDEVAEIRRHPAAGARLVLPIRRFHDALPYILFHHERWDGEGYPAGLSGRRIPIEARILAIADAFDAMISPRPYRRALTHDHALREVQEGAGSQFDPVAAELFVDAWADGWDTWHRAAAAS